MINELVTEERPHLLHPRQPTMPEIIEMYPSNSTEEGISHQNALLPKIKRAPFLLLFSSLDLDYADAVHRDATSVVFSEKDEVCQSLFSMQMNSWIISQRAVRRKIDKRILPMIFFRWELSYILLGLLIPYSSFLCTYSLPLFLWKIVHEELTQSMASVGDKFHVTKIICWNE